MGDDTEFLASVIFVVEPYRDLVENRGKVRRCLLSILQNFILAVSQVVN